MLAIATLLIVVMISLIVTRVASVALTLTGVSADVAKFQARSALSGTGFATAESEQIVGDPRRRQIIMGLMLFGNAGLVTTVASLSVSFATVETALGAVGQLSLLIAGLGVILLIARNEWVGRGMARVIERLLRQYTSLDVRDYVGLLHLGREFSVDRVRIADGDWLTGQTLLDAQLSREGVIVLGIERHDGSYIGAPTASTRVEAGDVMLIYGAGSVLAELSGRPAGPAGTEAHEANVRANQVRIEAEQATDRRRRMRSS